MACETAESYYEKGKIALERCKFDEATANFERALIEDDSANPDYWCMLGEAFYQQGRHQDSLDCWLIAASKRPQSKKIWFKLGALYALMNREKLAIHCCKIAEKMPLEL